MTDRTLPPRRLLAVASVTIACLAATPSALGFWTAGTRGTAHVSTMTLLSPRITMTATSTTVSLTLVNVAGQPSSASHSVRRHTGGDSFMPVPCTSSVTGPEGLTCLDEVGTPSTPVVYEVRTTLGQWSTSTTVASATSAGEAAPAPAEAPAVPAPDPQPVGDEAAQPPPPDSA